ncbi:hypothetical protein [Lihuaxuella thermophila]|uniref:Uncharacterized protein n=1 Tax=Lihuaxuella thermophila TaxID=1173111 RepID=A0A1H8HR77_9BACL|nr:hypothetical protein [Lihuaxuella thermophila]SEN58583.1 hypothetical protein SAMN05444955_1152 [Lihuaxuella thermophila]
MRTTSSNLPKANEKKEKAKISYIRATITVAIIAVLWYLIEENVYKWVAYTDYGQIVYWDGYGGIVASLVVSGLLGVYIYAFLNRKRWSMSSMTVTEKQFWIGYSVLVMIAFLITLFVLDKYSLVTEKGLVESSFWKLGDHEKVYWNQIDRAKLDIIKDKRGKVTVVYLECELKNGKTSTIESNFSRTNTRWMKKKDFVRAYQLVKQNKVPIQIMSIDSHDIGKIEGRFGREVAALFKK